MGINQSIHLANASGQDIYVIAALNPAWNITEVFVDAALLFTAVEEIKALTTAGELPKALVTIYDLYQLVKAAAGLLVANASEGTQPSEAVIAVIEAFKASSVHIRYGEALNISNRHSLGIYLNPDGIAKIHGAQTVSLMVLSDHGQQLCMFDSGPDDSWIATSHQLVVRSKYGTLWEENRIGGTHSWPRIKRG